MSLDPLYRSDNLDPAFQLRYSWTGWLKSAWIDMPDSRILETVDPLWEKDGMRRLAALLGQRSFSNHIQRKARSLAGPPCRSCERTTPIPVSQRGPWLSWFHPKGLCAFRRREYFAGCRLVWPTFDFSRPT